MHSVFEKNFECIIYLRTISRQSGIESKRTLLILQKYTIAKIIKIVISVVASSHTINKSHLIFIITTCTYVNLPNTKYVSSHFAKITSIKFNENDRED